MEPKRVVITGMGIISSVGNDLDTYWKNLVDGVCGIDYVEDFKDMPVTIAGKVKDFDPERYDMDKAFVRKQDKFTQFAMAAAWQAMQASGLKTEGEERHRRLRDPVPGDGQDGRGSHRQVGLPAVHPDDDFQHRRGPHRHQAPGQGPVPGHRHGLRHFLALPRRGVPRRPARLCRRDHRRRFRACLHSDRRGRLRQREGPFPRHESQIRFPPVQREPAGLRDG